MSYQSALRRLFSVNLFHPKNVETAQMEALYHKIGRPLDSIPVIHIAGTNGKGSVAVKVAEILRRCGLRVGLFTSPHLSSFRERIQVNGELISERSVEVSKKSGLTSTFFELVTAMACMEFHRRQADAVVLEVGIGGRLDATNSVGPVAVSVVTSVQYDHTNLLGNSLESIAFEKCSIFRKCVPAVVGPEVPIDVAQRIALTKGAYLNRLEDVLPRNECVNIADPEELNKLIARAAVQLLANQLGGTLFNSMATGFDDAMRLGVLAKPPCRYDIYEVTPECVSAPSAQFTPKRLNSSDVSDSSKGSDLILFDIAHNEAAIGAMVQKLRKDFPAKEKRIIFGMCRDKDVSACIRHLLLLVPPRAIICVQANQPRSISASQLRDLVQKEALELHIATEGCGNCLEYQSVTAAVRESLLAMIKNRNNKSINAAEADGSLVVVCGSAFLMSDARAAAGIVEPIDGI